MRAMAPQMDKETDHSLRAYLLHRLGDEDRDAFETRLLEDPELLKAAKSLETTILKGRDRGSDWLRYGVTLILGVLIGVGLAYVVSY